MPDGLNEQEQLLLATKDLVSRAFIHSNPMKVCSILNDLHDLLMTGVEGEKYTAWCKNYVDMREHLRTLKDAALEACDAFDAQPNHGSPDAKRIMDKLRAEIGDHEPYRPDRPVRTPCNCIPCSLKRFFWGEHE